MLVKKTLIDDGYSTHTGTKDTITFIIKLCVMWIEVEMNFTFVLRMKKEFTKQMNDIKLIIEFVRQVKA